MNINYWMRRLAGRATCTRAQGSRLLSSARIRNAQSYDGAIAIGENSLIAGELLVFAHGGRISIGSWCYIGEGARIWSASCIEIGDRVMVSHNVNMFDSTTHPLNPRLRHEHFCAIVESGHPKSIDLSESPIVVEDDAWIGASACILRGTRIGEGAIVGAAAVVTRDVPPYTIVAGNPACVIRELSSNER